MKLKFSLKNKEASFETDVERLVEKHMDLTAQKPEKKSRYQIKKEEKRKMKELEHKQQMQSMYLLLGVTAVFLVVGIIMTILGL